MEFARANVSECSSKERFDASWCMAAIHKELVRQPETMSWRTAMNVGSARPTTYPIAAMDNWTTATSSFGVAMDEKSSLCHAAWLPLTRPFGVAAMDETRITKLQVA